MVCKLSVASFYLWVLKKSSNKSTFKFHKIKFNSGNLTEAPNLYISREDIRPSRTLYVMHYPDTSESNISSPLCVGGSIRLDFPDNWLVDLWVVGGGLRSRGASVTAHIVGECMHGHVSSFVMVWNIPRTMDVRGIDWNMRRVKPLSEKFWNFWLNSCSLSWVVGVYWRLPRSNYYSAE